MTAASDHVVEASRLAEAATRFLEAHGAPAIPARVQAEHLVEAELRGHPSHGVRRLAVLSGRMDSGMIDPTAEPTIERVSGAALRIDGRRGFGPVTAHAAIESLLQLVPTTGIAIATMHSTHHLGMLAPYLERMADCGVASIVLSSTEGLVHPWGGAGALLGTNPIGIGIPAEGGDLAVDMSTGAVSAGKILDYRARGLDIPPGWAVDASGAPTTNAAAAADGAISPFGGPKGYALGLAFGTLVGALTGTALGPDVFGTLDVDRASTKGDVFIAIDTAGLAGRDTSAAVGRYFEAIRGSGTEAAIPGDRARAERAQRTREGVKVSADVWKLIEATAGVGE